jgi:hypothetical protein
VRALPIAPAQAQARRACGKACPETRLSCASAYQRGRIDVVVRRFMAARAKAREPALAIPDLSIGPWSVRNRPDVERRASEK